MKSCFVPLAAAALFASCSTVDEYHYGYAPAYRELPAGFQKADIRGTTYWHHGGRFYTYDADRGYLLVKPPRGHEAVVTAEGVATPTPDASANPAPAAASAPEEKRSWLAPGGGSIKEGPNKVRGRSPFGGR